MDLRGNPAHWRAFGCSVRGASHRRNKLPNQDALSWYPETARGAALTVAVADGHGSAGCFRSDAGADMAVKVATRMLNGDLDETFPSATEWLPGRIAEAWRSAVDEHLERNPFSAQDLEKLKSRPGVAPAQRARVAYGSTLLSVAVRPECILYLQLGDGDILLVSEEGQVSRPWPLDKRLLGVETTSLCSENALQEMRVLVQDGAECRPELVLLCTDGYANSFRDDGGFLQIGRDVLEMLREDGIEGVERNLSGWLTEASELGSGDDITLGGLWRTVEEPAGDVA